LASKFIISFNLLQKLLKIITPKFWAGWILILMHRMFIVNAPMLFSGVWAMIKPWLDQKTRDKITIIGGSY
jgi:hypothetical protein